MKAFNVIAKDLCNCGNAALETRELYVLNDFPGNSFIRADDEYLTKRMRRAETATMIFERNKAVALRTALESLVIELIAYLFPAAWAQSMSIGKLIA